MACTPMAVAMANASAVSGRPNKRQSARISEQDHSNNGWRQRRSARANRLFRNSGSKIPTPIRHTMVAAKISHSASANSSTSTDTATSESAASVRQGRDTILPDAILIPAPKSPRFSSSLFSVIRSRQAQPTISTRMSNMPSQVSRVREVCVRESTLKSPLSVPWNPPAIAEARRSPSQSPRLPPIAATSKTSAINARRNLPGSTPSRTRISRLRRRCSIAKR